MKEFNVVIYNGCWLCRVFYRGVCWVGILTLRVSNPLEISEDAIFLATIITILAGCYVFDK